MHFFLSTSLRRHVPSAEAQSALATFRSGRGLFVVGHVSSAVTAHAADMSASASVALQNEISLSSVVCLVTSPFVASLIP